MTVAITNPRPKKEQEKAELLEGDRDLFGAYLLDDESRGVTGEFAKQRGWPTDTVVRGGLAGALRTLSVAPPPRYVVVDVGPALSYEDVSEGIGEIVRSGAMVIALGERNDVQLYRAILDAGAHDYLVKPIDLGALNGSFAKLEAPNGSDGKLGRRIAFVGARGGVGASQIVSNCAWIMAEELRRKVYLVDMDLKFGTLALLLDTQAGGGLADALKDPERVDQVFLENAAVRIGKQLYLLAAEDNLGGEETHDPEGAQTLIEQVATIADATLVDLPRHLVLQHPGLLGHFDEVVIVTDASLVGLRDACRLLRLMRSKHADVRTITIVNHRDAKAEVETKEMEKGLEAQVDLELAFARDAMMRSEMAGEPLAKSQPKHPLSQALTRLTVQLAGVREAPKRAPLLRRMMKR